MVIILGIDPGLAHTGWGVVERSGSRCTPIAYGCISTHPDQSLAQRLALIHDEVRAVIERYGPAECAVESVYFGTNAKSAFATGQARGVAVLATAERSVVLAEYSPVQVKSSVAGSGSADKRQVAFMVRTLLELDHEPKPDHAADALAVAITHARLRDAARRAEAVSA